MIALDLNIIEAWWQRRLNAATDAEQILTADTLAGRIPDLLANMRELEAKLEAYRETVSTVLLYAHPCGAKEESDAIALLKSWERENWPEDGA